MSAQSKTYLNRTTSKFFFDYKNDNRKLLNSLSHSHDITLIDKSRRLYLNNVVKNLSNIIYLEMSTHKELDSKLISFLWSFILHK